MTIKELEERTGMSRANIRYYEEEKLISPRRLPNGYRDYTEEDRKTLEKIRLLRQLHLDIDTIRMVQQGQLRLEQALFNQLTRLEGDKTAIDRALEVCRRLERSGVEYGALEPKPWLEELKKPALSSVGAPSATRPPQAELTEAELWTRRNPARDHPWMRYFARAVDILLYGILFDVVGWMLIPAYMAAEHGLFLEWLLALAALVFALAVEPLWLHFWGYTPGKWIFGLKLRDKDGAKLFISEGYIRSFRVLKEGYGIHIPLYNLYRLWKGRRCCVDGEDCPWDAREGYLYGREERRRYGLYVAGAYVLAFVVTLLLVLDTHLPLHREPEGLTLAQYSENYNYILRVNHLEGYRTMEADGTLSGQSGSDSDVVIDISSTESLPAEYVVEDGVLHEVVLTTVSTDRGGICHWGLLRETLHLMAFSGAGDVNLWNYGRDEWAALLEESCLPWQDCELEHRGFRITVSCEYAGYFEASGLLLPVDGEEQSLTRTVTITWTGEEAV